MQKLIDEDFGKKATGGNAAGDFMNQSVALPDYAPMTARV